MKRIIVIGAGVSGLSIATMLSEDKNNDVLVLEKEKYAGGLIHCEKIDGCLYHTVGGHVYNSKRDDVNEWFWNNFNKEQEFVKADRNSIIFLDNDNTIEYPIENYLYKLPKETTKKIIKDLLELRCNSFENSNFSEYLMNTFGKTLNDLYFEPYNSKIWNTSLKNVSLAWLEGKLPMPSLEDIIFSNIYKEKEKTFVHSTFYYEKEGGSQYIADKLANKLNIQYNTEVKSIEKKDCFWIVNDIFKADIVIYCGNIKKLTTVLKVGLIDDFREAIDRLNYHGTTSVFCKIDKNPYSWCYLPNREYKAHRIICTGNFSKNNNSGDYCTGTVEFTDFISYDDILKQLERIPLSPKYITHKYTEFTYPIQDSNTRSIITNIKEKLEPEKFYLLGRFAEWEYYNMDAAIGAALDLKKNNF